MSVSGYRAIAGKVRGRWSALNELKLANDLVRLNTNQRLTAVNAVPIRALTWTRAAVYALLGSKNAGQGFASLSSLGCWITSGNT